MNHSIHTAYYDYHQYVERLTDSSDETGEQIDDGSILTLLQNRDLIQSLIDKSKDRYSSANISAQLLINLSEDDTAFGSWYRQLLEVKAFKTWRKTLNPPKHHWWWYPDAEKESKQAVWWLSGATIALLTICVALARDISARFLTGAPGIWSSIGAVAPAAIALFATGGALTKVGSQLIDKILSKRWKSPLARSQAKAKLALVLTVVFGLGHLLGLPLAALHFHSAGRQHYNADRLTNAQSSFQRALQLNPNLLRANHGLALTYEDTREFDRAKAEYAKAAAGGYLSSVNNLARLLIMQEEDYESAEVLLDKAIGDAGFDIGQNPGLEYGLQKNLGWAWVGLEEWEDAESALIKANRIAEENDRAQPDAYCLLAQVNEELGDSDSAESNWKKCGDSIGRPEDYVWQRMARRALEKYENPSSLEISEE